MPSSLPVRARHLASRSLHNYADWRIGALDIEKRCYKSSDSILLTFDDYGTAEQIESILNILDAKRVKAMFFVQGDWFDSHPDIARLLSASGHVIGNHTYTHLILKGMSAAEIAAEVNWGLPSPWIRPPQGSYDKQVRQICHNLGLRICYWTIDSNDWRGHCPAVVQHTILSEIHPGASILLHMHCQQTIDSLPELIDSIRLSGYQLTDFNENWYPAIYR